MREVLHHMNSKYKINSVNYLNKLTQYDKCFVLSLFSAVTALLCHLKENLVRLRKWLSAFIFLVVAVNQRWWWHILPRQLVLDNEYQFLCFLSNLPAKIKIDYKKSHVSCLLHAPRRQLRFQSLLYLAFIKELKRKCSNLNDKPDIWI